MREDGRIWGVWVRLRDGDISARTAIPLPGGLSPNAAHFWNASGEDKGKARKRTFACGLRSGESESRNNDRHDLRSNLLIVPVWF